MERVHAGDPGCMQIKALLMPQWCPVPSGAQYSVVPIQYPGTTWLPLPLTSNRHHTLRGVTGLSHGLMVKTTDWDWAMTAGRSKSGWFCGARQARAQMLRQHEWWFHTER